MSNYVTLPLEAIYARVLAEHEFDISGVQEAEDLVRSLSDICCVDPTKLAASMLCLGWQYRQAHRYDDADHMFLQALKYFRVEPFEQNRNTSRTLWFLAENNYMHTNFDLGRSLFWRAVKEFAATTGLFDEEALACLEEFRELAEGFARDEDTADDVDGMLDFTAFLHEQGCDGHVTVVAS